MPSWQDYSMYAITRPLVTSLDLNGLELLVRGAVTGSEFRCRKLRAGKPAYGFSLTIKIGLANQ